MAEVSGVLVGAFPRSEALIKSFREYFKGRLGEEELKRKILEESREVVKLQEQNGLRYLVDGMLWWHDLLRPFAERLSGVELNGLARWFDNNTFYKRPIIVGEVSRKRPLLEERVFPDLTSPGKWKLIVPDPYTFTTLSEIRGRIRFEEALFQFAEALREEIIYLESKVKVGQVQLSAPMLVWKRLRGDALEMAGEAVEEALKGVKAEKMLHLYFGDGGNALPHVLDYKVDIIGFDMTATSLRELIEYQVRRVALGLIDGRNSLMERPDLVARQIREYVERCEVKKLYLTPSCDLEFLPPEVAREKVRLLGRVLATVGEEL